MRQIYGQAVDGRFEFGTGLRARLKSAGTPLTLVTEANDASDEAFGLLLDLSRKVDGRENLNLGHSRAIAVLARNLARSLGLDEDSAQRAYLAGMFHDLGKIELPETLLRKPGPLSGREWTQMASHAEVGANLVDRIAGMHDVATIVASHHERWDGVGYPNRIAGEEIPLEARIVSASDAFVTMTSERPFRSALPVTTAITELIRSAGSGYDPAVVGALLELAVERKLGIGESAARPLPRLAAVG